MQLNGKKRISWLVLVVSCVLPLLNACESMYERQESMDDWIERSVREELQLLYPIPEGCSIVTHVGDLVTYRSVLSAAELELFYLEAYNQQGTELVSKQEGATRTETSLRFGQAREGRTALVLIEAKKDHCLVRLSLE